jgi:hypothetical protein
MRQSLHETRERLKRGEVLAGVFCKTTAPS